MNNVRVKRVEKLLDFPFDNWINQECVKSVFFHEYKGRKISSIDTLRRLWICDVLIRNNTLKNKKQKSIKIYLSKEQFKNINSITKL